MSRRGLFVMGENSFKAFSLNFQTYLKMEGVNALHSQDAKDILRNPEENFNVIICMNEIGSENTLKIVLDILKEFKLNIPVVSLGEDPRMIEAYHQMNIACTEESDDIRQAVKEASELLGMSANDVMEIPTSKYFPIPIENFISLEKSPTDTFIKIGKGDNAKYIKRIHQGEGLQEEALQRYIGSGVTDLYVESELRGTFVAALTEDLMKVLDDTKAEPVKVLTAIERAQETVAKNIEALGITPEIEKVSKKSIKRMIVQAEKFPRINKLIEMLLNNKAGFRFKHTQVTTYLGRAILQKIDWGTPEQEETLSFVSFFHDISLRKDAQCLIHSEKDLKESPITAKDKDLVNRHAQISAEYIHNYPHMPMGANTIIRQHHGMMNGLGFSETYSGSLSPLALVFMVAEKAAHIVLGSQFEELNRMKILYELEQTFKTKRFEKMLEAISEVME